MTIFRRMLMVVDRTMIEVRLADGFGIRAIARYLGRPPGTALRANNNETSSPREFRP